MEVQVSIYAVEGSPHPAFTMSLRVPNDRLINMEEYVAQFLYDVLDKELWHSCEWEIELRQPARPGFFPVAQRKAVPVSVYFG